MTIIENAYPGLPLVPRTDVAGPSNRPRSGLLKWIGNKARFADAIAAYFPERFGAYFEPFVGSAALLGRLSPLRAFASDTYAPLIEIWTTLRTDPEQLKSWYRERWSFFTAGDKHERYASLLRNFNKTPNGADFVFLCRACYGGVVRFRKNDGFMSTPCGIHRPINPPSFDLRVDDWSERVSGTQFTLEDYSRTMRRAEKGDLVYCDPPYVHTQKILYGAQDFKLNKLFSEIGACKKRGVYIALSIDGHKRSGREVLSLALPGDLFEREIIMEGGASMLMRFQKKGKKLDHERVSDRLLLTY